MKNKCNIILCSIKKNNEIFRILNSKHTIKKQLPFISIWINNQHKFNGIRFALLVTKAQFKLAVQRNKIKRQLRSILINSNNLFHKCDILLKPNKLFLNKKYNEIRDKILNLINNNGKQFNF